MRIKRLLALFICIILVASFAPTQVFAVTDVVSTEAPSTPPTTDEETTPEDKSDPITAIYNYYNYYILNNTDFDYLDIYSLNNLDKDAYWRPKYDELAIPLKEYVEFNGEKIKINSNGFDVDWTDINKEGLTTSRALEILGYDFLRTQDIVSETTGELIRTPVGTSNITADLFIMNIYKALGMELYDVYFIPDTVTSKCGVYITRTNPSTYWEKFLNDHPINYDIYNNYNVDDISVGRVISTADAITILAQMLDFYGEPVISKQEEYLLLQVYSKDVPVTLPSQQREAWSYLKCRGIIGEQELDYTSSLSFTDMMDLLMRSKDTGSRTNFKEVQITTNLDASFIQAGYYESDVSIRTAPDVTPITREIDWSQSDRIDYLIKFDNEILFKNGTTDKLNRNIFISKGDSYQDTPIKGSVYHGIVEGSYYHFSVPKTEVDADIVLYINSSEDGDWPYNYQLPTTSGGVYSVPYDHLSGYLKYEPPTTFHETLPNSNYVDKNRISLGTTGAPKVLAASSTTKTLTYDTTMLDKNKTLEVLKTIDGVTSSEISKDGMTLTVKHTRDAAVGEKIINRALVLGGTYVTSSFNTSAILGMKDGQLYVSSATATKLGIIKQSFSIKDSTLIMYTVDGDMIIVDDENDTIQKGNSYLQLPHDGPPLFTGTTTEVSVDFRAFFGLGNATFTMSYTDGVKPVITLVKDPIQFMTNKSSDILRVGKYQYFPTLQCLGYAGTTREDTGKVGLLYEYDHTITNLSNKDIKSVLLPLSSSNVLGNYVMYSQMASNGSGFMESYLVVANINQVKAATNNTNKTLGDLFRYIPGDKVSNHYNISIFKLDSTNTSFIDVNGIGWCYKLEVVPNDTPAKIAFMKKYRESTTPMLPFAICTSYATGNSSPAPRMFNFNLNYLSDDVRDNLTTPGGTYSYNTSKAAPIGVQSWFTRTELVRTIETESLKNPNVRSRPILYWGSMKVSIGEKKNSKNETVKTLTTDVGNIDLFAPRDITARGVNRVAYSGSDFLSPDFYALEFNDIVTLESTLKEDVTNATIDTKSAELQKFFDQFEGITFLNFIAALDNSMSIAYYIITRVVPLIILCLLILVMLISSLSEIKIVQLFCTKCFDPIKILTIGNYNIQTVNNKYLLLSLIGALTIFGIIQSGNLEKIIMFVVRFAYAAAMFFE